MPWGWTTALSPNNAQLVAIAEKFITQTTAPVYNWEFPLYPVSGNTRDWGYGELGIPSCHRALRRRLLLVVQLVPGIISNMLPA